MTCNLITLIKKLNLVVLILFLFLSSSTNAQKPEWDNYETYLNSSYASSKYNSTLKKAYQIISSNEFDNTTKCYKALEYFLKAAENGCRSPQVYKDAMLCYLKRSFFMLSAEKINESMFTIDPSKDEQTIKYLYDIVISYYDDSDPKPWRNLYYYSNLLKIVAPGDKSIYEKIGNVLLQTDQSPVGHFDYLHTKSFALSHDGRYIAVAYEKDITSYEIFPDDYCFSAQNLKKEYANVDSFLKDKELSRQPFLTSGIISLEEKPIDERKKLKLMLLHSFMKGDTTSFPLPQDTIVYLMAYSIGDYYYEKKASDKEKEMMLVMKSLIDNKSLNNHLIEAFYQPVYPKILYSVNDLNFALFPDDCNYFFQNIDIATLTKSTDYRWQISAESAFMQDSIRALSAAVSYDKKYKLIGFKDGTIKLFDIAKNKVVREFKQPEKNVYSVNISCDNKIIVSSDRNTIYMFDGENGKLLKEFICEKVNKLAVSKDNRFIFAAGNDGVAIFLKDSKNAAKEYYIKAGLSEAAINEKLK